MNSLVQKKGRALKPSEIKTLVDMSLESEWLANKINPRTTRAYRRDIIDFTSFGNISNPASLRMITGKEVRKWRDDLIKRELSPASIRRKLSALASLFDYLCEKNVVNNNPVDGVDRPPVENANEGKTPELSNNQARKLLEAPPLNGLKGKRDRAILVTLLYHGFRRSELCNMLVKDIIQRKGIDHFRVIGKGGKMRDIPIHPKAKRLITEYLEEAGHIEDEKGALFRPVKNNMTGDLNKKMTSDAIYKLVRHYAKQAGLEYVRGLCVHSLRATAATNALDNEADIKRVQEWLGHANISTTRLYDRRETKAEESPTFRVHY